MTDALIINPEGTAATVTWFDDSMTHDSNTLTYTVVLTFADPALNPPEADDGGWIAGTLVEHYKRFTPDMALAVAKRFYDFLMNFRTLYGQEEQINRWRRNFEAERQVVYAKQRTIQDYQDGERLLKARIAELETDHVKEVEALNERLRADIIALHEQTAAMIKHMKP